MGYQRGLSLRDRFMQYVAPDPMSGCWLWTASTTAKGYGQFVTKTERLAHRVSLVMHGLVLPEGACVLHRCDTPSCVNPDHLFLGTVADNNADMARKGRSGRKKLSTSVLAEVRQAIARGEKDRSIASKCGVTPAAIGHIRRGTNYRRAQS